MAWVPSSPWPEFWWARRCSFWPGDGCACGHGSPASTMDRCCWRSSPRQVGSRGLPSQGRPSWRRFAFSVGTASGGQRSASRGAPGPLRRVGHRRRRQWRPALVRPSRAVPPRELGRWARAAVPPLSEPPHQPPHQRPLAPDRLPPRRSRPRWAGCRSTIRPRARPPTETVNAQYVVCAGRRPVEHRDQPVGRGPPLARDRGRESGRPRRPDEPPRAWHAATDPGVVSRRRHSFPTRSPSPRRIVVEKGDTLSGLAAEHLDAAARWPEIKQANESLVDDPDHIEVGWRLRLPQGSPSNGAGHPGMLSAAAAQSASRPPGRDGGRRGFARRRGGCAGQCSRRRRASRAGLHT